MDTRQLLNDDEDEGTGALPIALYPNNMRRDADGKQSYYGKVIFRKTLTLANLARDASNQNSSLDENTLLYHWKILNELIIDRVQNGYIVDTGIGTFFAKVVGVFATENDSFNSERHSIELSFRIGKKAQEIFAKVKAVIRQGNRATPEITSVFDLNSGSDKTLTRGGFLTITGKNITIAGDDSAVGLYFENVDDTAKSLRIPAERIGDNTSTRLALVVPTELADGRYQIKIITQFTRGKQNRKEPLTFTFPTIFTVG